MMWATLLVSALLVALPGQRQECCQLTVQVTTSDGPVEGAAIQVVDRQGGLIASATTDGLGDARIGLRPGSYEVRASARGHAPLLGGRFATESVTVAAEEASLRLWLVAQETPSTSADETAAPIVYGAIRGIVRDQEGHPIAGAKVDVTGHRVGMVRSGRTITGEDGRYRVVVPTDTYSVMASKGSPRPPVTQPPMVPAVWSSYPGVSGTAPVQVHALRDTSVDLHLPVRNAYRITATLRDAAGRAPTSPATVHYSGLKDGGSGFPTKPDGTVQLGPVLPGPVTILATAYDAYPPLVGMIRVDVVDRALDDVQLTMGPGGRVSGRIVFDGRSRPLHGSAPLRVLGHRVGLMSEGVSEYDPRGVTDAEGNFALDALVGDVCFSVFGAPPDWNLQSISLGGEDLTGRPLRFEAGQDVAGLMLTMIESAHDVSSPPTERGACAAPYRQQP